MTRDEPDTARLAEASAWRVALHEADADSSADFEAWLASDPRNRDAWRQVGAVWDRFDEDAEPELSAVRRGALERATRERRRRLAAARRWKVGRLAAAVALGVFLSTAIGVGVWRSTRADTYETAIGERRTITLADGSHVDLDANSLLRVRLLPKRRWLELVRGQARFQVAHDVTRPFTVHARDKAVVATGTSFNVDLFGGNVIVTLIEGKVSILQERAAEAPIVGPRPRPLVLAKLTPGEQLIAPQASPDRTVAVPTTAILENVSIDRTTAWESGQLIFDNEPLASVVPEVARYGEHPVVVDQNVGALRISGVFNAGDLAAFADAVQRELPVVAETGDDGVLHLRRRAAPTS
jgi:transmembrane sensor